ncbi:MAG: CBS domain-containing protein [Kofleriaceae bacterium]
MTHTIEEVMTKNVHCVTKDTNLRDVARLMHDRNIGDVLVTNRDGTLYGIATDRDLVVRGLATQRDVDKMQVAEICSNSLADVAPEASIEDAVQLMRNRAIRRIPVVRDGKPIGIVSMGDIARVLDPISALAQISRADPNN